VVMTARRPSGETRQVRVPLNMNVYRSDGRFLTMVNLLFESERAANAAEFTKELSAPPSTRLNVTMHPRWNLPGGHAADEIYALWLEVQPPEAQLIEELVVVADVAVEEVPTIEMTARQLGDVAYAYGETTLHGQRALFVLTADEAGGILTVRTRRDRPKQSGPPSHAADAASGASGNPERHG
jgi:hypothetical protein